MSWGFHGFVYLWNPTISYAKPFIGRFEGHSGVVSFCRFLKHTTSCISIDDRKVVKIWDYRSFATLQSLALESLNTSIRFLHILPNDSFIFGTKKVYFYSNEDLKKQLKLMAESNPVLVEFNNHFKNFIILTKFDMRILNAVSGRVERAFSDIITLDNGEYTAVRATAFCQGARDRKFYIGDSQGSIKMFNTKNGQFMKQVNDIETDYQRIEKIAQITSQKMNEKFDREVTNLLYLSDEKILIATINSVVILYDEIDSEESELLRFFLGGHDDSQITAIKFSQELSLLATGSANGMVTIWDMENACHAATFSGHADKVLDLAFLTPFAVLASASVDGHLCLWQLAINPETSFKLLARFLVYDHIEEAVHRPSALTCMTCWNRECGDLECPISPYITGLTDSELDSDEVPAQVLEDLRYLFRFLKKADPENSLKPSDFHKMFQKHLQRGRAAFRNLLIFGTEAGLILVADLMPFLKDRRAPTIGDHAKKYKNQESKIRRTENIAAHKSAVASVELFVRSQETLGEIYDLARTCAITRSQAHANRVNSLSIIHMTNYFVSCSLDYSIKIWNLRGENNSEISMLVGQQRTWQFHFDWIKVIKQEFEELFKNLEIIRGRVFPQSERDEILRDYLQRVYVDRKDDSKPHPGFKRHIQRLAHSLLKENIKKMASRENKSESLQDKKRRELIEREAPHELQRVLEKSHNFRNATLRAETSSMLGNKIMSRFDKVLKEDEKKITYGNFMNIASTVMNQMRKARTSLRMSVVPGVRGITDLDFGVNDEDSPKRKSRLAKNQALVSPVRQKIEVDAEALALNKKLQHFNTQGVSMPTIFKGAVKKLKELKLLHASGDPQPAGDSQAGQPDPKEEPSKAKGASERSKTNPHFLQSSYKKSQPASSKQLLSPSNPSFPSQMGSKKDSVVAAPSVSKLRSDPTFEFASKDEVVHKPDSPSKDDKKSFKSQATKQSGLSFSKERKLMRTYTKKSTALDLTQIKVKANPNLNKFQMDPRFQQECQMDEIDEYDAFYRMKRPEPNPETKEMRRTLPDHFTRSASKGSIGYRGSKASERTGDAAQIGGRPKDRQSALPAALQQNPDPVLEPPADYFSKITSFTDEKAFKKQIRTITKKEPERFLDYAEKFMEELPRQLSHARSSTLHLVSRTAKSSTVRQAIQSIRQQTSDAPADSQRASAASFVVTRDPLLARMHKHIQMASVHSKTTAHLRAPTRASTSTRNHLPASKTARNFRTSENSFLKITQSAFNG